MIRAASSCEVRRQAALAERLGTPLLVPLFPRPKAAGEGDNLYLHALTRAALTAEAPALKRVDLQLLAMADDARKLLAAKGVPVDAKLLLRGFSASGSFVNRFAVLHPERVLAVACGSPGGWPLAPAAKAGGETLPYPVGIADVRGADGKARRRSRARGRRLVLFPRREGRERRRGLPGQLLEGGRGARLPPLRRRRRSRGGRRPRTSTRRPASTRASSSTRASGTR